jgi:hypothetical protein
VHKQIKHLGLNHGFDFYQYLNQRGCRKYQPPTNGFYGTPVVCCAACSMHGSKLPEAVDGFEHPFWNNLRITVSGKAMGMRRLGFSGAAMLPSAELEYTDTREKLKALATRFHQRHDLTRFTRPAVLLRPHAAYRVSSP